MRHKKMTYAACIPTDINEILPVLDWFDVVPICCISRIICSTAKAAPTNVKFTASLNSVSFSFVDTTIDIFVLHYHSLPVISTFCSSKLNADAEDRLYYFSLLMSISLETSNFGSMMLLMKLTISLATVVVLSWRDRQSVRWRALYQNVPVASCLAHDEEFRLILSFPLNRSTYSMEVFEWTRLGWSRSSFQDSDRTLSGRRKLSKAFPSRSRFTLTVRVRRQPRKTFPSLVQSGKL